MGFWKSEKFWRAYEKDSLSSLALRRVTIITIWHGKNVWREGIVAASLTHTKKSFCRRKKLAVNFFFERSKVEYLKCQSISLWVFSKFPDKWSYVIQKNELIYCWIQNHWLDQSARWIKERRKHRRKSWLGLGCCTRIPEWWAVMLRLRKLRQTVVVLKITIVLHFLPNSF